MALHPVHIDKQSPFVGEHCALCKEPFAPGDEIVVCPDDATRHHTHCWQANGNRCSAFGCQGRGAIVDVEPPAPSTVPEEATSESGRGRRARRGRRAGDTPPGQGRRSKVRVMPASSFSCAQSCLLLAVAVAILLIAFSCFGLWAIADYIMVNWLNLPYREPLSLWLQMPAF